MKDKGEILETNLIKLREYEACFQSVNSECSDADGFREAYESADRAFKKRVEIGLSHSDLKDETKNWLETDSSEFIPAFVKDDLESNRTTLRFAAGG